MALRCKRVSGHTHAYWLRVEFPTSNTARRSHSVGHNYAHFYCSTCLFIQKINAIPNVSGCSYLSPTPFRSEGKGATLPLNTGQGAVKLLIPIDHPISTRFFCFNHSTFFLSDSFPTKLKGGLKPNPTNQSARCAN